MMELAGSAVLPAYLCVCVFIGRFCHADRWRQCVMLVVVVVVVVSVVVVFFCQRLRSCASSCSCRRRRFHRLELLVSPIPSLSRLVQLRTLLCTMVSRNRKRIEREKDKALRDAARATLKELEESLSQGLALVSSEREHPGIKPQADTGNYPSCSRFLGLVNMPAQGDDVVLFSLSVYTGDSLICFHPPCLSGVERFFF